MSFFQLFSRLAARGSAMFHSRQRDPLHVLQARCEAADNKILALIRANRILTRDNLILKEHLHRLRTCSTPDHRPTPSAPQTP